MVWPSQHETMIKIGGLAIAQQPEATVDGEAVTIILIIIMIILIIIMIILINIFMMMTMQVVQRLRAC